MSASPLAFQVVGKLGSSSGWLISSWAALLLSLLLVVPWETLSDATTDTFLSRLYSGEGQKGWESLQFHSSVLTQILWYLPLTANRIRLRTFPSFCHTWSPTTRGPEVLGWNTDGVPQGMLVWLGT